MRIPKTMNSAPWKSLGSPSLDSKEEKREIFSSQQTPILRDISSAVGDFAGVSIAAGEASSHHQPASPLSKELSGTLINTGLSSLSTQTTNKEIRLNPNKDHHEFSLNKEKKIYRLTHRGWEVEDPCTGELEMTEDFREEEAFKNVPGSDPHDVEENDQLIREVFTIYLGNQTRVTDLVKIAREAEKEQPSEQLIEHYFRSAEIAEKIKAFHLHAQPRIPVGELIARATAPEPVDDNDDGSDQRYLGRLLEDRCSVS